jgi:hypothetical protein
MLLIGSCGWVPHPLVSKGAVLDFFFFELLWTFFISTPQTAYLIELSVSPNQFVSHVMRTEEPHPYNPKGAAPTPNPKSLLGDLLQWYHALVCGVTQKKTRIEV